MSYVITDKPIYDSKLEMLSALPEGATVKIVSTDTSWYVEVHYPRWKNPVHRLNPGYIKGEWDQKEVLRDQVDKILNLFGIRYYKVVDV